MFVVDVAVTRQQCVVKGTNISLNMKDVGDIERFDVLMRVGEDHVTKD